jgi:hypothetical protein
LRRLSADRIQRKDLRGLIDPRPADRILVVLLQ